MAKEEMDRPGWFHIEEQLTSGVLRQIADKTALHKIEIKPPKSYEALLTRQMARELAEYSDLQELVLWCKVERAAINEIIAIPGLKSIVIMFDIVGSGRLRGFERAGKLEKFACDYDIVEADILEITRAPVLRILRAHASKPTLASIKAILKMPHLVSLDFEDSSFDDQMAQLVASSPRIIDLEIGATRISAKGLQSISAMTQLRKLDIWANNIDLDDLDCLRHLSQLEFLSIGSSGQAEKFAGERLIEKLEAITSLKRLWLDGVSLNEAQLARLRERFEQVQFTPSDA